ncbi:3'-5' exoribonuclease YhaM family protein [Melioribacteraceae bacterium 4301-Me]|uniref:3'-5' exoribonuclease YhaM family protein n=1 Tax=Pyranulibacter aquaticus TaxID=3163344 RepID=UPI003597D726
MNKQKNLNEIKPGEEIILFLVVDKIELKTTKGGNPYLNLELRDKTGSISAKLWERAEETYSQIMPNSIVKIAGKMEEFNGNPQIKIEKIRPAVESDGISFEFFLAKSNRKLEEMINELNSFIESVKNPFLNKLLVTVFSGKTLEKFQTAPAGKGWHHAYIHGLLEHTIEIAKICELMCTFHKELNRDLLISGALLHDLGKIEELTYQTFFDYTDKGKLLGHIVIAALEVQQAIDRINDFPEELKEQILHLILSHQGKLEFASPVEPRTLEAITLYQADELSAKTNAYKLAIAAEKNKDVSWTKYLPLAETSLFIPKNNQS